VDDENDAASRFVGLTLDEAARLASERGLRLRVIDPDGVYTMEFDEGRVNVTIGPDGRVERARIG
jgi:hypothetical protein